MALKEINSDITVDTEALLAAGDQYWSNYHEKVLTVVNEMHAKGLNLLNENRFGNLTERDYNWLVVKK